MDISCATAVKAHNNVCLYSNLVTNCSAIESESIFCNEVSILHVIGGVLSSFFFFCFSLSACLCDTAFVVVCFAESKLFLVLLGCI